MSKKYFFIFCVFISNLSFAYQNVQNVREREGRKLLILKLIEALPAALGLNANAIPVEKLSLALNQISRTKICQSENINNPFITALPGQDTSSGPCRVFCKEERGVGLLGITNVRYFVALLPEGTSCLIDDGSVIPLGVCTVGICIAPVVVPPANGTATAGVATG